ncbi:MAG: methylmalonyl-CoA mutase family protein, partial [Flavobacteriales bacterium]
ETVRGYNKWVDAQAVIAQRLYGINQSIEAVDAAPADSREALRKALTDLYRACEISLDGLNKQLIEQWPEKVSRFHQEFYSYQVRGKEVKVKTYTESLARTHISKIATPRFEAWGDVLRWNLQENFPGEFPYTAGVYPFKRTEEDPTRMFAGEGGPERTNRRFHYVSKGMPAKRLSTAFDSVTLYGHDPDRRPDIYGKIGNSGVSICCLDDAKKLYSGFNL